MEREPKTNWRELIKAFISSDGELEKQENEEEIEFNRRNIEILSKSRKDISSLEAMLEHPDVKVKGKERRSQRNQTRFKTKEAVLENREKTVSKADKELER